MATAFVSMFQTANAFMGAPHQLPTGPISGAVVNAAGSGPGISSPSFMSGMTSVLGGLSSIMKGNQEAKGYEFEAQQLEMDASDEELAGRQQVINLLRATNSDLAQISAASGASGIGFSGSSKQAHDDAIDVGESNIAISREQTRARATGLRGQASMSRVSGGSAKAGGYSDAAFGLFEMFRRGERRGDY